MTSQKNIFLHTEADAWYARNREILINRRTCPVVNSLESLRLASRSVLEIGCSNGYRLHWLHKNHGAACHGLDPSRLAIEEGRVLYPDISFTVGTADDLPYPDAAFDMVIFGFCLYMCDPTDLFQIAREADRVLASQGFLVIYDFMVRHPFRNAYLHSPGLFSHKFDFSSMFSWHPAYRLLHRAYGETGQEFTFDENEAMSVDIIRKDITQAFQERICK